MPFVIDESSWQATGSDDSFLEEVEAFLDLAEDACAGDDVLYCAELFYVDIVGGRTLYDLYRPGGPVHIPRVLQERLAVLFARLARWDEEELPQSLEVEIGGTRMFAPSIAWAHGRNLRKAERANGVIVLGGRRHHGLVQVVVEDTAQEMWLIADGAGRRRYYRWLIVDWTKRPDEFESLAALAFPDLRFAPGVFDGFKHFSKGYREMVEPVVSHLGVLCDHGRRIFLGPWQNAAAEFGSHGVTISDENGRTKSDKKARNERTITIDGEEQVFWWHTKIEPDRDRIHILPDLVSRGDRIVIGIMHAHLHLPD